jgi:hypothetical protein
MKKKDNGKRKRRVLRSVTFSFALFVAFELILSTAKVQALDWPTAANSIVLVAFVVGLVVVVFLFTRLLGQTTTTHSQNIDTALRELGQASSRQPASSEAPGRPELPRPLPMDTEKVERLVGGGWRMVEVNGAGGFAINQNGGSTWYTLTPGEVRYWKRLEGRPGPHLLTHVIE